MTIKKLKYKLGGDRWSELHEGKELAVGVGEEIVFELSSGGHWYGHGFAHEQPYPLERGKIDNPAFAVNNIQSPIWLCSAGFAIFADTSGKLKVSINKDNDGMLRIITVEKSATMRIFHGGSLPEAWRQLASAIGWPNKPPAREFFEDSIFCTWTQYPRAITQERILDMARQIRKQGYPCSTLTIDDRWETCFGELSFSEKFPEPKQMIKELHGLGFRVLLWVTPFVNVEARNHKELADAKILVQAKDGKGAALLKWWGGTAGLVDLTNPSARSWFKAQLLRLKKDFDVDGFKIDGGDAKYQPDIQISSWNDYRGASGYLDELLSVFEEVAPNICESRTAWLSQGRQIIWRQGGKDSHWGLDNGLKAVVTLAMHMSLMGYDILMPDMIPGRVQTLQSDMPLPTDELMVRWTEVSAFMPVMQFSYFPWNYCAGTAGIACVYSRIHRLLGKYLANNSSFRKAPLIRPLWFDYPEVEEYYGIPDQYMLGKDLIVAPILDTEVHSRKILLPSGKWRELTTGKSYTGPLTLKKFPVKCPGIPVFIRVQNSELFDILHKEFLGLQGITVKPGITTSKYLCGLDRDLSVTG
ncbi:MAG TPA: hypothetical protein DCZ94_01480 [Lentisphaeria bacterium]|nr:MAG: hypothetical protein A2X48_00120 [Lentisphaerae bacterium GWF2_49_21]HBC85602.1 hypothetical protein [Lentisphaeria bacterium]